MPEYEHSQTIQAAPQTIFDFVADVSNLPKYLPTTKSAQEQGEERVRVQGEAKGIATMQTATCAPMRRNSPGMGRRRRLLFRLAASRGAERQRARQRAGTVHLSFKEKLGQDSGHAPSDADIQEGMQKALQSIQNYVEGTGGKEEPAAAT
jgi:hypothetical protein